MKTNIINSIVILLLSGLFVACSNSSDPTEITPQSKIVTISTDVTSSRVSYTDNNGLVPTWESSDALTVYRGSISSSTKGTFSSPANIKTTELGVTSATFTGTLAESGANLYAFVNSSNLVFDETAGTATLDLSSQTGTLVDIKKYNLLTSTTAYNNESSISMSFGYKMAVLKLALTVPTTTTISSLKLHASSGLYNKVVFDAAGALQSTSTAGDISMSGASWTSGTDNQTTTVYACVYPGQLNDLYVYVTDANNKVYSVKIGSKTLVAGTVYPITKTLATFVGSGTSRAPYQVGDESTLRLLSYVSNETIGTYPTAIYKQTANITLSGKAWEPINFFDGSYTGTGFTIGGSMDMSKSTSTSLGLFGEVGANTSATTLTGITIASGTTITLPSTSSSARNYFGAVVGTALNCTVSDCTNNANASGAVSYMGGIVGWSRSVGGSMQIIHCTNSGNLSNTSTWTETTELNYSSANCCAACVGGIVGDVNSTVSYPAVVEACANTGTINCSSTSIYASAGGLVGYLNIYDGVSKNIIRGCYSKASTISGYCAGGLIGCASAGNGTASVTATASIATSCWSNTQYSSITSSNTRKTTIGSVTGNSNYCSFYYCAVQSKPYFSSTLNGVDSNNTPTNWTNCIQYSTASGNTLSDWIITKTTNLNTAWNGANSSRIYQFSSDGSITNK